MKFAMKTPAALAAAALGLMVGQLHAATINVGSDTTNGYTLDKTFTTVSGGDDLIDTNTATNSDALAFSNTSSSNDGVGAHLFTNDSNTTGAVVPNDNNNNGGHQPAYDGDTKTLVYHFQPDAGFKITGAVVDNNAFVAPDAGNTAADGQHQAGGSVSGFFSTDNINYTQYFTISGDANDRFDHNLADTGFTEGQDLYLKYTLERDAGIDDNTPQRSQIFRTQRDGNGNIVADYDGFQVQLDLAQATIPEPASLALLGIGGLGMLAGCRRRDRDRA